MHAGQNWEDNPTEKAHFHSEPTPSLAFIYFLSGPRISPSRIQFHLESNPNRDSINLSFPSLRLPSFPALTCLLLLLSLLLITPSIHPTFLPTHCKPNQLCPSFLARRVRPLIFWPLGIFHSIFCPGPSVRPTARPPACRHCESCPKPNCLPACRSFLFPASLSQGVNRSHNFTISSLIIDLHRQKGSKKM